MGHAGAIVLGDKGTFAAKRDALEAAGAKVVATPTVIAPALKAMLG
jgi:succinyl-CoA synthetase alpha subunit